jgi:hypothetical protein
VSDTLLWRKLRSIESAGTPKSLKNPAIKVDSRVVDEPSEVANIFASNLETVFSDPNDPSYDSHFHHLVENSVSNLFKSNPERIYFISENEVIENIKKLRSRGAPGEDLITKLLIFV